MNTACIIIAQIIAIIAFGFTILSTEADNKKDVLLYNGTANCLAIIEYILLGAWAGALSCTLAFLRNLIFKRYEVVPTKVVVIYLISVIIISIPTIDSFISTLPLTNIIAYTIALSRNNIKAIKIVSIYTCFTGAAYNLVNYAFVGILTTSIEAVTSTIGYMKVVKNEKNYLYNQLLKYTTIVVYFFYNFQIY